MSGRAWFRISLLFLGISLAGYYAFRVVELPTEEFPKRVLSDLQASQYFRAQVGEDAQYDWDLSVFEKGETLLLLKGSVRGRKGKVAINARARRQPDGAIEILVIQLFSHGRCLALRNGREIACDQRRVRRKAREYLGRMLW